MIVASLVDRLLVRRERDDNPVHSERPDQRVWVLFVILNSFGLGIRLSVGKLLAEAFAHWKIAVWALVINFVVIPLLFVGYLLTIAASIPERSRSGSVSQP